MSYAGPDGLIHLDDLKALLQRPEWHADAACREHPEIDFFPTRGDDVRPAKRICARCLVRFECAMFAVGEKQGIWGGLSERERRGARVDGGIPIPVRIQPTAGCGTRGGFQRHKKRGEQCAECQEAERLYRRDAERRRAAVRRKTKLARETAPAGEDEGRRAS